MRNNRTVLGREIVGMAEGKDGTEEMGKRILYGCCGGFLIPLGALEPGLVLGTLKWGSFSRCRNIDYCNLPIGAVVGFL